MSLRRRCLSLVSISLYLSYLWYLSHEKIHKTDITLWKPPVQMSNTKETTDATYCTSPMHLFRTTDTTDTTDTTIWKPGFKPPRFRL